MHPKSLKKGVGSVIGHGSGAGSRSIILKYGSADPDPHQNVTDPQHTGCVPNLVFSSMRARVRFSRGRLFLAAAVVAAAAPLVAAPVVAAPVVAASKWPADFVLRCSTVPSSTKGIQCYRYGSGMFIQDPNFFYPGSRIQSQKDSRSASKNFSIYPQKLVSKLSEIWSGMLQSGIGILYFHPSRIQKSKRHRIPDPDPQHGHERMIKKQNKCGKFPSSVSQPVFFIFLFESISPQVHTTANACCS